MKRMATIRVDYRERRLFEPLLPGAEFVNLDTGDFLIVREGGELVMVVERKTLADLAASVKDGRYVEQKARMMATVEGDPRRLALVVEGALFGPEPPDTPVEGVSLGALRTLVLHAQHRDGIAVYNVQDVAGTAALIAHMAEKVQPWPERVSGGGAYVSAVRPKKSENMTPRNVAILQLCVVPGMSARMAEAVLDTVGCGSMAALCAALTADPEGFLKRVSDARPGNGRGRRVGEAVAKRLSDALK